MRFQFSHHRLGVFISIRIYPKVCWSNIFQFWILILNAPAVAFRITEYLMLSSAVEQLEEYAFCQRFSQFQSEFGCSVGNLIFFLHELVAYLVPLRQRLQLLLSIKSFVKDVAPIVWYNKISYTILSISEFLGSGRHSFQIINLNYRLSLFDLSYRVITG